MHKFYEVIDPKVLNILLSLAISKNELHSFSYGILVQRPIALRIQ